MSHIYRRPRLKIFSSRDKKVIYDPHRAVCISYRTVVGLVYPGRIVILTDYNYSRTTNRHLSELKYFFKKGILEHEVLTVPCKILHHDAYQYYIDETKKAIEDLSKSMKRKRCPWRIEAYQNKINSYIKTVKKIEDFLLRKAIGEALGDPNEEQLSSGF